MATIDELQVQITANAANFEKELGGVKKQLSSLSHSTSSMSSKMTAGFVAVGFVADEDHLPSGKLVKDPLSTFG